jgi:hypothetical protein
MKNSALLALSLFCLAGLLMLAGEGATRPAGTPDPVEWIDVHVHLVGGRGGTQAYEQALGSALDAVEGTGIRKMIVMPPPQLYGNPGNHDYDSFLDAVRQYPTRFAFLGGGGSLNPMIQAEGERGVVSDSVRHEFEEQASQILKQGALGFGEITAHHLSHTTGHPYESVAPDHPLLLLLADIAARDNVLIDFHFDVVAEEAKAPEWLDSPPNPRSFRANLAGFERLLAHNRKARFVWAHAGSDMLGFWTTDLSRKLLEKHSNLYMSLRMAPGRAPQNHPMDRGGGIRPEWMRLLRDFPDRFVIGGDQFFAAPSIRGTGPGVLFSQRAPIVRQRTRAFLAALPPDLYRKIAFENAIRLYKLKD